MKKVLVVNTIPSLPDYGQFNVAFNYVKISKEHYQYDFLFAIKSKNDAKLTLEEMGINVLYPSVSRLKQPIRYMMWLRKLMTEKKYDILHVHGNSATMYLEIHAAKMAGIEKRICHVHSTTCKYMLVHKLFKKPMLKEMTAAVACSREAGQWIFGNHFVVLPNGINTERFAYQDTMRNEIRNMFGLQDKYVIGQAGTLDKQKNYEYSIDLVHVLKAEMKNVVLIIVGDGALREQLTAKVKSLDLGNDVIFLGKRNDIERIYSAMDCFIFPSISEGFGLVLIEAQASGLSCIASDRVPQITQVSDHTVYLPLENQRVWMEQIKKFAEEKKDRKQESHANIEAIIRKGYDMRDNVNHLIELYGDNSERQN